MRRETHETEVEISSWKDRFMPYAIAFFILGWITDGYSILDVGKYSILLLYVAALPFCLFITSRTLTFFALPALSTFFATVIALLQGVSLMSVLSQSALQILAIIFAAGVSSVDWKKYLVPFAKILVVMAVPVVALGGWQMFARAGGWPYAFLPVTNQQAYAVGGYQRGWEKPHFTRASSLFVEPSDFGYFCLWLLVSGMAIEKGKWRYFCLSVAFAGILFSQSLSAVLGVGIFVLIYLFTNPISVAVVRQIAIVSLFCVVAILCIEPLMPEAFAKFFGRVQEAVSLDERADSGRVDHLPACWAIFKDAPSWGHGIASLNSADANGTDVTSVAYALLLMERGVIGTILFMAPWIYVGFKSLLMPPKNSARTPGLLLSALHLYCFATFSFAYFLPFWLSLGVAASLISRTYRPSYQLSLRQPQPNVFLPSS
jgi:O-antigen ligase